MNWSRPYGRKGTTWAEGVQNGPNGPKRLELTEVDKVDWVDQIDQSRLKWTLELTEVDQMDQNGLKCNTNLIGV